ncbi:MAG: hypothetical protein BGO10_04965 [Chlamydia sp. 32-24]|nr:MAG: hypothetical protein BGO10_04965 [Chlamydia sp. 32-24]
MRKIIFCLILLFANGYGNEFNTVFFGSESNKLQPISNEASSAIFKKIASLQPGQIFFLGNYSAVFQDPKTTIQKSIEETKRQIKAISDQSISFYPLILKGERQEIEAIYKDLQVKQIQFFSDNSYAFLVSVQDTDYIAFSSDLTKELMDWLQDVLAKTSAKIKIVMGPKPFATVVPIVGPGLIQEGERNLRANFWQKLTSHKVLAYLCSQEDLYDRRFENGIWKIVIGGGVWAEANEDILLLNIPKSSLKLIPEVRVYNMAGQLKDLFHLKNGRAL